MKSDISRKLIKTFMTHRKSDSEFKPVAPIKPGDEHYPKKMVKLINFEVENYKSQAPGTCLQFNESIKRKSSSKKKLKEKRKGKADYDAFKTYFKLANQMNPNPNGSSALCFTTKLSKSKIIAKKHGSDERSKSRKGDEITYKLYVFLLTV